MTEPHPADRPLSVCILAAGRGTRMKSEVPKVLHAIAGAPLLEYVLDAVRGLDGPPVARVVSVVGYQAEAVKQALPAEAWGGEYVLQDPPQGTGDAIRKAKPVLEPATRGGDVLVLLGDVPLIRPDTLARLIAHHRSQGALATMLTMDVPDPTGYGRVLRTGAGAVCGVVEHKDASDEQRRIREVNTGIGVYDANALWAALAKVGNDNAKGEYYLTDVYAILDKEHEGAEARPCHGLLAADYREVMGINTRVDLAHADRVIRDRLLTDHMLAGVTVVDPSNTYIEKGVTIGCDTVVMPFTVIRRGVRVGAHCEVGPFAHLRAGTRLHDTAEIGNFVECKKAEVGPHTKAKHLTYLGDVTLGAHTNVGAGTVVCNYDGVNKHKTRIGDRVFIGSGSMIVAPRVIGDDAGTSAGSVVTKDVPEKKIAIGAPARMRDRKVPKKKPKA